MMRVIERLRVYVRDLLSGVMGPTAQALAWRIASLHPGLRVIRDVRAGQIRAPLAVLDRGTFGLSDAARLRDRLADMVAFSDARTRATPQQDAAPRPQRTGFNGNVLFALHSCGAFDPSGYASRSVALLSALVRRGVRPVITTRPGYPWDLPGQHGIAKATGIDHRGLHFHLHPDPRFGLRDQDSAYIVGYAGRLQALAEEQGVSVIHAASNYLNGAAAAVAGRRTGLPSVYEVRGLWHLTRAFLEPGYAHSDHFKYCEQRELAACEDVDHVITISPGLRDWLVERGVRPDKITVLGNAAPGRAAPNESAAAIAADVRRRHHISAGSRIVGYLGSLVAYEGIDVLLRAHARTPSGRRPHVLIVGSGKHERTLRQLARDLGTTAQVTFAGHVPADQVPGHFAAMDAVVLPRRDDALTRLVPALKPFEALAERRPVFVSPALAQALGTTLPGGYHVLDVDAIDDLGQLFEGRAPVHLTVHVPTWDHRAEELEQLYVRLCSGPIGARGRLTD